MTDSSRSAAGPGPAVQPTLEVPFERTRSQLMPGAIHVPDWLTLEQQRKLVAQCRAWATEPAGMRHPRMRNGSVMSVQMVCLGWHWTPYQYTRTAIDLPGAPPVAPMPLWLRHLGQAALRAASHPEQYSPFSINADQPQTSEEAAEQYWPDAALINFYRPTASMGLHRDQDEHINAPVVSLSLGDDCLFRFVTGEQPGTEQTDLLLRSGDLFVFGGPARFQSHGVPRIFPGTGPSIGLPEGRLNLTLRQTGLVDP